MVEINNEVVIAFPHPAQAESMKEKTLLEEEVDTEEMEDSSSDGTYSSTVIEETIDDDPSEQVACTD